MKFHDEYILLERLQNSELEALETIYIRYAPKVRSFAFKLLKNEVDADDITQDIFLRLWENRGGGNSINSLSGYIFGMTKNAIFNAFRRRQIFGRIASELRSSTSENNCETEDRIAMEELAHMVHSQVENMPQQRRAVFNMSREEEMTYNDIARELHISPKTVHYHISSALAQLRKLLS